MSDDKNGTATNVHGEHWRQHPNCKKWGSFGYDRDKGATDWWCLEHRPDEAGGSRLRPYRRGGITTFASMVMHNGQRATGQVVVINARTQANAMMKLLDAGLRTRHNH